MVYAISKLVPVFMSSTYTDASSGRRFRSRWIQWRGAVIAHQKIALG